MTKQSLLQGDLLHSKLSNELDADLRVLSLIKILKKYSNLIPRYELLGYINIFLASEISRQLIRDRVGCYDKGGSREDSSSK